MKMNGNCFLATVFWQLFSITEKVFAFLFHFFLPKSLSTSVSVPLLSLFSYA